MTADAQPPLSREERRMLLACGQAVGAAIAALLLSSWLHFENQRDARQEARAAMAAVLTLNDGFAYSNGVERVGAQGSQLQDEPYALFLLDAQGPAGTALQRGLSWQACDTMAIVLDAAHDRSGGACVPERREAEIWKDFASLLRP